MPKLVPVRALLALGLAFSSTAWAKNEAPKGQKPKLELRAAPRMAVSPAQVLFTAELKGGVDLEDFHCPEIEWDWDDGGTIVL